MKTSTIKTVTANGTFESKHGLLYKFEYEMVDGTTLSANHKSKDNAFNIGDEVEYEVKGTNDYGSWGTVKKPESDSKASSGGDSYQPKDQGAIMRQTAGKIVGTLYAQTSEYANTEKQIEAAKRWTKYFETGE